MLPVGKTCLRQTQQPPIQATSSGKRMRVFIILLAAGCLTTMTGGIVSPVLPEMVQQLQFDPNWAGMMVSAHALAIALCTPIMGILADRIGKLKVMLPSLILYAVFGVTGAFIPNLALLIVFRALLGVASGGIAAATIGLLGSLYEGEARSRVLGYATSAMTTASILVPLLGGWVGQRDWHYAFFLYSLGIPLAAIAIWGLREPKSRQSSVIADNQRAQLLRVLRQRNVVGLYLLLAVAAMIVYAVVIYTPLYLKTAINAGPELNGLVLAVRGMGAAIVSALIASRLAKWLGTRQAIAIGFTLMAITIATIPFLTQLELILPTAVLFGSGFGIITPNIYSTLANYSPAEMRASVLAIGTGFNSLGQFISPLILGPIWKNMGLPVVFYVAGAIALLTAFLSLVRKKAQE
jgi:predicted MFS family arabinose efflux permease